MVEPRIGNVELGDGVAGLVGDADLAERRVVGLERVVVAAEGVAGDSPRAIEVGRSTASASMRRSGAVAP